MKGKLLSYDRTNIEILLAIFMHYYFIIIKLFTVGIYNRYMQLI